MNELALFAGAGGGILGGLLLGWRTVCAVELDPYARSILLARQRDGMLQPFPIWDDVATFDGQPWRGHVDVVSGGFPCQDISCAGKGAGLDGERSGLWSEFARIIREVRPRFAFIENSPMLVVRGLDRVLSDLAAMGFDAEWGIVSAADVGAPHKRDRIWIVAHARASNASNDTGLTKSGDGRTKPNKLGWAVAMLPTPDAHCWKSGPRGNGTGGAEMLSNTVAARWPTPIANDAEKRGNFDTENPRNGLPAAVKRYMTPTASIGTKCGGRHNGKADTLASQIAELEGMQQTSTGQLNPTWVEWLMNWPQGWTATEPMKIEKWKFWKESSAAHFQSNGVRDVWFDNDPSTPPQRPEPDEQLPREHLRSLSRVPQVGTHEGWHLGYRESCGGDMQGLRANIHAEENQKGGDMRLSVPVEMGKNQRGEALEHSPRVATGVNNRVARLRAIGNGQVPRVAATAWRILSERFHDD